MQINEILIIKNGSESFGISTEDISQIFRVPDIMPLPLRPNVARGLSAVGGSITNVLDINMLLDIGKVDLDSDKSRLLTLTDEKSFNSLLVSEVYNTIEIDSSKIEYINRDDNSVVAIYKLKDMIVQILSIESLISKIKPLSIESKTVNEGKIKVDEKMDEDLKRFLIFNMENEKFALEIDFLREIILSDVNITDISGSNDEVLGLITLRNELITVIDLRTFYGFEKKESDKNRILITTIENNIIGLLVDEIVDIKNFSIEDIEYMHDDFERNKLSGVLHDDDKLISFLDDKVLKEILKKNESFIDSKTNESGGDIVSSDKSELILFKLNSKEYAFEVDNVAEIIDAEKVTSVALTNKVIEGVINIRGQIVIIVSLFNILNIAENINEDSKIMVCNINGNKIGFVVDSVSDILTVNNKDIIPQDDEYITDVLHLDSGNRLVLKMDINKIIAKRDINCGKKSIDC